MWRYRMIFFIMHSTYRKCYLSTDVPIRILCSQHHVYDIIVKPTQNQRKHYLTGNEYRKQLSSLASMNIGYLLIWTLWYWPPLRSIYPSFRLNISIKLTSPKSNNITQGVHRFDSVKMYSWRVWSIYLPRIPRAQKSGPDEVWVNVFFPLLIIWKTYKYTRS